MEKMKPAALFRAAAILILTVLFVLTVCMVNFSFLAYADSTEYSDVLDDLKKDVNFDESYYLEDTDDYSLQVIQLAESSAGELFVYIYQPSGQSRNFNASSINISTEINDDISYKNYKLRRLNCEGVFYKYLVEGLEVSAEPVRYYAVSSVYRPFDESIDEDANYGNHVTEVEYKVARQYGFGTLNGKPYVQAVDIETIEITDKFVGFVRYSDGYEYVTDGACDSHFVAFSTDRKIDKLLEADVYYTTQSYMLYEYSTVNEGFNTEETYGDAQDKYAYLTYDQKVTHTGDGLFAATYEWDRIETVEQFIAENEKEQNVFSCAGLNVSVENKITDLGKSALADKQWVLRFDETEYESSITQTSVGGSFYYHRIVTKTIVGDVTILRLKFETDGMVYNLGVIDNKQSGSDTPVNDEDVNVTFELEGCVNALATALMIIALLVLFILLWPILPYIAKAIVWVISLPFKGIAAIVKAVKKKKPKDTGQTVSNTVKATQPKAIKTTQNKTSAEKLKDENKR